MARGRRQGAMRAGVGQLEFGGGRATAGRRVREVKLEACDTREVVDRLTKARSNLLRLWAHA